MSEDQEIEDEFEQMLSSINASNLSTPPQSQTQTQPNPIAFDGFLLSIGVKAVDVPILFQGGLTETEDLSTLDSKAIDEFDISPISHGALRNYILWRDIYLNPYSDTTEYVLVSKGEILKARQELDSERKLSEEVGITTRKKAPADKPPSRNSDFNELLVDSLRRQTGLLSDIAGAATLKQQKSFMETFKANSECPKFTGKDDQWCNFKRQFKAYLGAYNLIHLLK
ncbi:MAG: hypothetical protein ACREOZ_05370, partial [Gloeomargaritales cyanobacterium]